MWDEKIRSNEHCGEAILLFTEMARLAAAFSSATLELAVACASFSAASISCIFVHQ